MKDTKETPKQQADGPFETSASTSVEPANEAFGFTFYDADTQTKKKIIYGLNDHGKLTQIENVLFAETGFDFVNRSILCALTGIGKNTLDFEGRSAKWFAAGKTAIANQLMKHHPKMRDTETDSRRDRVDHYLNRLFADQQAKGVLWIEEKRMPFDKQTRKNPPNQYRLVYQEYAAEALYRAYTDPERYNDGEPGVVWEKAAREVAGEWKAKVIGEAKSDGRHGWQKKKGQTVAAAEKSALGMMKSFAKRYAEEHGAAYLLDELRRIADVAAFQVTEEIQRQQQNTEGGGKLPPP